MKNIVLLSVIILAFESKDDFEYQKKGGKNEGEVSCKL